MAAPGFGFSVGDFIAVINIIVKSIHAIKDSTGSAAEYRAVAASLESVARTLEDLNKLRLKDPNERHALELAARKCGETIYQFANKISKYKLSLESGSSV